MSNYKISMIIPEFNVEDNLKRAFGSLLNQTIDFENIEVLFMPSVTVPVLAEAMIEY